MIPPFWTKFEDVLLPLLLILLLLLMELLSGIVTTLPLLKLEFELDDHFILRAIDTKYLLYSLFIADVTAAIHTLELEIIYKRWYIFPLSFVALIWQNTNVAPFLENIGYFVSLRFSFVNYI